MKNSSLKEVLINGLQQLDISLPDEAIQKLLDYQTLLQKWNQAYNLTAVNEPKEMIIRHLLDCLATLSFFPEQSPVLDVGSGAGLPGIVLAIARPQQQFHLLDSLGKRTIFLEKVVRDLKLENVLVINSRVEKYQPNLLFAVITSRAYSSLNDFLETTQHLSGGETLYFALKGKVQEEELSEIKGKVNDLQIKELQIPYLDAERHIITFNRKV